VYQNIAKKTRKCSLRRAINVTFSKFRGWRRKKNKFFKTTLRADSINSLIRIISGPKILRSYFLHCFYDISVTLELSPLLIPVALENWMSCRDGWTHIGPTTLILATHTPTTSSWWSADLSLGRAASKTTSRCQLPKLNSLLQAKPGKRPFISVRHSRMLATNKIPPLKSMMTIWHV